MIGIAIWMAAAALPPAPAAELSAGPVAAHHSSARGRSRLEQVSLHLDRFDVRILAARREVWHGKLDVNRMDAARYTQARMEPDRPSCAGLKPGLQRRHELEFQINKYGGNITDPDEYRFSVSWRRSVPASDCSRTVTTEARLEERVRLDAGQAIVLDDGGGLIVEIRRLR